MRLRRLLGALAVLGAVSAGGTATADATDNTHTTQAVTWTLDAAKCTQMPPGMKIDGTGTLHLTAGVKTDKDGRTTLTEVGVATGTADDGHGNTFTWVYRNRNRAKNSASAPEIYVGTMSDSFALTGTTLRFDNGFEAGLTRNFAFSEMKLTPTKVWGDPFDFDKTEGRCDPL